MKSAITLIFIVLFAAAGVLWYIFVYAQSTTTELRYGQEAVVVGIKECAPKLAYRTGFGDDQGCAMAIKDDVGHYFVDKTSTEKKLLIGDTVRITGFLVKADNDFLEKYKVDGYIVDSIKE